MSLEVLGPGVSVKLKSDMRQCPKLMTVQGIDSNEWVHCVWFLDDNRIEQRAFRPESLSVVYSSTPELLTE